MIFLKLSLLLIILLFNINPNAWAETLHLEKRPLLMVPVVVEDRELEAVWFYPVQGNAASMVDAPMLLNIIKPFLSSPTEIDQFLIRSSERFVALDTLPSKSFSVQFDEQELNLKVKLVAADRKLMHIPLETGSSLKSVNSAGPAFFSAYSNFYLSQSFSRYSTPLDDESDHSSFKRDPFYLTSDIGMSFGKAVVLSSLQYQEDRPVDWVLGQTQALWDFTSIKSRLHLGEFEVQTAGLQQPVALGGVMVHHVHEGSSALAQMTSDWQKLILKDESIVEIYINRQLVHRERYPAGPIAFSNFPFSGGANNVEMKIIDRSGKIEMLNFSRLYDAELLGENQWEYSAAYGSQRDEDQFGRGKYQQGWDSSSAFIRYGLRSDFTLGANFQRLNDVLLFGGEALVPFTFGLVENHLAQSHGDAASGQAYRLSFRSFESINGVSLPYSFRVLGEWNSRQFSYGAGSSTFFSAYYSYKIPFPYIDFAFLGAGVGKRYYYHQTASYDLRSDLTLNVWRDYNLSLSAMRRIDPSNKSETSVAINFIWTDQTDNRSVWASHDSLSNDSSVRFRGQNRGERINHRYDLKLGHSATGDYLQVDNSATGQRGEIATQYWARKQENGHQAQYLNFESRFSLAMVNQHLAWGRHVGDSFAIIRTEPAPETSLSLKETNAGQKMAVNSFGPILLGDLAPQTRQEYSFDVSSLSDGDSLTPELHSFIPEYKRGHLLESSLIHYMAMQAQIVDSKQQPLSYISGKVLTETGEQHSSFFSNRNGRIFVEKLTPGIYTLEIAGDQPSSVMISISPSKQIIDKGVLQFKDVQ